MARIAAVVVAVVAAVLLQPASGWSQVKISHQRVVVTAKAARAVIERHPFNLRIQDGKGRRVLREVEGAGAAPLPTPPTIDPIPPGMDNPSAPTLYAPLAFLVGSESIRQYDGGLWGGNLMSGERSGVQYSAGAVRRAKRVGKGVRLLLSTSDPSGRVLRVRVTPVGCCAIGVRVIPRPSAGVAMVGDSFASTPSEAFFGFGGRHNALDQHGNTFSSFIAEENLDGLTGIGVGGGGTSLFPNGPAAAYYPQPEFISSRHYGFLLDQPHLARFQLDDQQPTAWNVTSSAARLRYIIAPGGAPRAIRTLTAITGRQPVPPRWGLGPMLDRLIRNFGETEADYESNVYADLDNIARYGLPLTAYRIEGWGFPGGNDGFFLHSFISADDQARVIATLRARGIHPLVYMRPWMTLDSAAVANGWVAKHADGSPYMTTGTAGQRIALLDFTNPSAVSFWKQEVTKALDLGADGFMQDFGEEVLYGMHFHNGETGATMHNRYLVLFAKATREAIRAYERRHPRRRIWFFTRAGYTGKPGSAAYENANFPGDETTDWTRSSGLASSTPDMLNRAIGGAYGFGTDIGGYFDLTTPPTTKELFLRWAEWAALSPVFRLHGAGPTGTHTPWSFDEETVQLYIRLSRLHLKAVPLIMRLWRKALRTGIPPTRPLWLAYPRDRTARAQDQEWLLGPDLLVAPVVEQGATSRSVYFPAGCWRSPVTGQRYKGPRSAVVPAPLTELPRFFRCGTHPLSHRPGPRR
ncbi:MAG TPA: TIM-barrel domain-containing protein [Solirubrobacterales bacterium]|nr:TIM-barrel domain-containing protein [Solirubrobacterales bacterium]